MWTLLGALLPLMKDDKGANWNMHVSGGFVFLIGGYVVSVPLSAVGKNLHKGSQAPMQLQWFWAWPSSDQHTGTLTWLSSATGSLTLATQLAPLL